MEYPDLPTFEEGMQQQASDIAATIISLSHMHISRDDACLEGWHLSLTLAEKSVGELYSPQGVIAYAREVYRYTYSIVEQKWQELDELRAEEALRPKKRDWWPL